MTKWTNALNLPAPIVAAITNDPYSSGDADISVTSLIAPARQRELMRPPRPERPLHPRKGQRHRHC